MIVTAHQPNFLPGMSVVEKIAVSDAVIWLDQVQYTDGFINRNKMPDGSWLTVPIRHGLPRMISDVKIAMHRNWRVKAAATLHQHYGDAANTFIREIGRPYGKLVGLNLACLRHLTDTRKWHFQSHLDAGDAVRANADTPDELLPISDRLAMMVYELGGTTYLSGPSGFRYLNEQPFKELGIDVEYFTWTGDNPCSLEKHARFHAAR